MISFFANRNGSGEIRGRQIAEHLGARLNPPDGYEGDVCVWVKRQPPDDHPGRTYLDVLDGEERIPWLKHHPEVGVIASSLSGRRYLEKALGRPVVYIPQHHCNFERAVKIMQRPYKLGLVGGKASVPPADWGVEWFGHLRTRVDVVAAYQMIDVQVIWRCGTKPLKNALKILNAASFGIPTVAYPEPGFEEVDGYYYPATTREGVFDALAQIEAEHSAARLIARAEPYHISRIARLYGQL